MLSDSGEVRIEQVDLEPWPILWGREMFAADLVAAAGSDKPECLASAYADVRYAATGDLEVLQALEGSGADTLVEFTKVRVPREHRGNRYGLRLVAETLAQLTQDRWCVVTIIAEPMGWQSLKQRDRWPALVALDRHWRLLGFDQPTVRADCGDHTMRMLTRDYQPPEDVLLGWSH